MRRRVCASARIWARGGAAKMMACRCPWAATWPTNEGCSRVRRRWTLSPNFMEYRRFGRTELRMPVFSCGGMRYQYKWQDVAPDEVPPDNQKNLEATIQRALELGINHIETARGY